MKKSKLKKRVRELEKCIVLAEGVANDWQRAYNEEFARRAQPQLTTSTGTVWFYPATFTNYA